MKKYLTQKSIILASILILAIASAFLVLTNKVFKFAEFHDYYSVTFNGSDNSKVAEVVNSFSNDVNAAKLIRSENKVYFENTNIQDLDNKIKANLKEGVTYSTVVNISPKLEWQIVNDILFSIIIIGVVVYLAAFAVVLRFNEKIKLKQYLQIFFIFTLSLIFAVLIQFGVISFVSNYYQIRFLDLASLYTLVLFLSLIFFLGIYHYKTKEGVSLIAISDTLTDEARKHTKKTIYISLIILVLASIGLGINFVTYAVFIFTSLIVALAGIYFVGHIFKINIDEIRQSLKTPKQLKKKETQNLASVRKSKIVKNVDNMPKKKKVEKKEKKKKKDKKVKPGRKTR